MNELDRLKEAFDAERVAPRAGAREAAITAALAAFDANNRIGAPRIGTRQPVSGTRRLPRCEILTGKRPMTQISMRHALAGGVSLAVLTLAVMTAANLQTIEGFKWRETREPIGVPPVEHDSGRRRSRSAQRRADTPTAERVDATRRGGPRSSGELTRRASRRRRRRSPPPAAESEVGSSVAADARDGAALRPTVSPAAPPLADMAASRRAVRCGADERSRRSPPAR